MKILLAEIIQLVIKCMGDNIQFLRRTVISYGGFSVSLWDISISLLIITALIMIAFPWFNGGDDD